MKYRLVLLFFSCLVIQTYAQAKVIKSGDYEVRMQEKASKIQLLSNGTVMSQVTMDELIEVGADGKNINDHAYRNFAQAEPTFSDIETKNISGLEAKVITFTAALDGAAKLKVKVILFAENGTITNEANETYYIEKGAMKFSVEISDWLFCGQDGANCKKSSSIGKYLDMVINIKGKDGEEEEEKVDKKKKASGKNGGKNSNRTLDTYELAGDMEVTVSPQMQRDGDWVDMPEGYPKFEKKGGKQVMTFRFEAVDGNVTKSFFFDPVIQKESKSKNKTDNGGDGGKDEEKTMTAGDFEVRLKDKASKIQFLRKKAVQKQIVIDELVELKADGKHLPAHTFKNFAKSSPKFTEVETKKVYGVDAQAVSFTADLIGSAKLKVDVVLFSKSANITNEANETYYILKGAMKFSVQIEDWLFCGEPMAPACGTTADHGQYLDFKLEVRGKDGADSKKPKKKEKASGKKKKGGKGKRELESFDMGDDIEMTLSPQVRRNDNEWVDMPEGYPKFETRGNKQMFTFRFKRNGNLTTKMFFYDPVMQQTFDKEKKPSSADTRLSALSTCLMFVVFTVVKMFI